MPVAEILALLVLGLVAGLLGGLLGIGGSIIMIPALTVVLGRHQHLAQAAAMIVNVFVAVPALVRHQRAGAVRWDVAGRMLPAALVLIVIGVELSNRIPAARLKQIFGVFLIYVVAVNVRKLIDRSAEPAPHEHRTGWPTSSVVGGVMGFAAGLLGIGGGGIAVPLLQRVANLPLRQCIATSTAVMCLTAVLGAWRKNASLDTLAAEGGVTAGLTLGESLLTAACLAPTAIVGGLLGAGLTHRLPLDWVRLAFILLMVWASANMLGLLA